MLCSCIRDSTPDLVRLFMADRRRHRGPHPADRKLFASSQIALLREAVFDLHWLLDRGYADRSSLKLVGDRYVLTARQRTAVARSVCSTEQIKRRHASRINSAELSGKTIWLDGFNVLTSIEAALAGGVLIRGLDGCLRDMASMHGSYRKVTQTAPAVELVGRFLESLQVANCRWLLDRPVSNSGRLRSILVDLAERRSWSWEVDLVPDPDPMLATAEVCVATADSGILDQARHWFNLAGLLVFSKIPGAWTIDLSAGDDHETTDNSNAVGAP